MIKDWLLFVATSNFKLTAGEIYLAFKMALSRELLDDKGNEIDLYPELSNNTTGKVLNSYLRHKENNIAYQSAKDKLRSLKTPKIEFTDSEREELKSDFVKMVFDDIVSAGYSDDVHHLFMDLEANGKIVLTTAEKKKIHSQQFKIFVAETKAEFAKKGGIKSVNLTKEFMAKIKSNQPQTTVINRCRNICVSNYLKTYIDDFEVFKSKIKFKF